MLELVLLFWYMGGFKYVESFERYLWTFLERCIMHVNSSSLPLQTHPYFTECDHCWMGFAYVASVRSQGPCQCCSAFAVCEVVFAIYGILRKTMVLLAPQYIINCMPHKNNKPDSNGCRNACQSRVYKFAKKEGLDEESNYPYKGRAEPCKSTSVKGRRIEIGGFRFNDKDRHPRMMLLSHPLTARFDVYLGIGDFVGEGVYQPPAGLKPMGKHCVMVIGYGRTKDGQDYYLIKNTWGVDWGFYGFAKVSPTCLSKFSYPILN